MSNPEKFDAILLLSFGGPEGMDDVMPFLENVLRGKNVPEARMKEVAKHYELFDGVSPINAQNRELIALLEEEMKRRDVDLPVYWGNRNWHPMLGDTLASMKKDGVQNALAYVTSAYNSYSGCKQYLQNIDDARKAVGEGAPKISKLRAFFNHPKFIDSICKRVRETVSVDLSSIPFAFTAHSIPVSMSKTCDYEAQLKETCTLVAKELGIQKWDLVYQSRSGPPQVPWLEPDICDHIEALASDGHKEVAVCPIGFVSDHMEVIYDLDVEAKDKAQEFGMKFFRVSSPGNHPTFVELIVDLIEERMEGREKASLGEMAAAPDICAPDCCNYTPMRPKR